MNEIIYQIDLVFQKGGWILFPLFILSQSAWILCIRHWWFLQKSRFSTDTILNLKPKNKEDFFNSLTQGCGDNLLKRICLCASKNLSSTNSLSKKLQETIIKIQFSLHKSLGTIAIITKSLPLLGLFGTIQGIKITFDIIQQYGNGSPSIMATGISTALITTQSSLILSIPLIFFHNYLLNQIHDIELKCIQSSHHILHLNQKIL